MCTRSVSEMKCLDHLSVRRLVEETRCHTVSSNWCAAMGIVYFQLALAFSL